ncbi:hypothetical protein [Pseudomonas sp. JUb96]|uniref:hypothetical protein n=1 Tax=Pseudomonas sp. JUb96 TaxID=2940539 RepID=UPI002225ED06|nr:hypothetical protein [Pseudomonas sp. JUb96]MCW2267591.1 hypothetical protein [Pseudomonas sp. JUb96]
MSDLNNILDELTGTAAVPDDEVGDDYAPEHETLTDDEQVASFEAYAADRNEMLGVDAEGEPLAVADDAQPTGRSNKQVPLGALQEERSKRRALQAELDQHRQQLAQLQQMQEQLQALQQQAAIPQFEEDPQAHIDARFQQLERHQAAEARRRQFNERIDHVNREMSATAPEVVRAEEEFAAQHGDYAEAAAFLDAEVNARVRQAHPGASESDHVLAKKFAILAFAKDCQAKGLNPARLIYAKAQELGFQSRQGVPPATKQRGPQVSAGRLGEMSDAEFDKLFSDMEDAAVVRPSF